MYPEGAALRALCFLRQVKMQMTLIERLRAAHNGGIPNSIII